MPPKTNPLRLNDLQRRTLALAQVLARESDMAERHAATGEVTLHALPNPHGNHFHVGPYTVPRRAASGLFNAAVWTALERKGLVRPSATGAVTLTVEGLAYDTGLGGAFAHADH
jgi:hypothetical protein